MNDCEHRYVGPTIPQSRPPPHSWRPPHPQSHPPGHDEPDNNNYRFEEARLQSYRLKNWPVPFMDPSKLAAAGFYYTGDADKVRCFECNVEICQWVEGDDPMTDHQRWSGRCRFIRKCPCGNVPIGEDAANVPPPLPRSRDVCGPYGVEIRLGSGPECAPPPGDYQLPSNAKLGSMNIGRAKMPAHPEFASYESRMRSFETWPKSMAQTKEMLVEAGFYYTGKGDQTLCYHCGGGLKDWEPEDDPWEQHAKWFSKCFYLMLVKGQEYVNRVKGVDVPPPSREETMQMNLPSFIQRVPVSDAEAEHKPNLDNNPGPSCSSTGETEPSSVVPGAKPADEKVPVDDARLCKICYTEELGVVFLPCGHMMACVKCAPSLTTCAMCRQPFTMIVRAFLS